VLARAVNDGQVTVVYLAPRYATAIRMHEATSSVVVGDPASLSAEHSEHEPILLAKIFNDLQGGFSNVVEGWW
jgi:hypothetical protein